jgi:hypothetical protein
MSTQTTSIKEIRDRSFDMRQKAIPLQDRKNCLLANRWKVAAALTLQRAVECRADPQTCAPPLCSYQPTVQHIAMKNAENKSTKEVIKETI